MNLKDMCDVHQQPIVCFNNKEQTQEFLCLQCIVTKFSFTPIEDFNSSQLRSQMEQYGKSIDLLKQLSEGLELYKQQIQQIIERLQIQITQLITIIQDKQLICKGNFEKFKQRSVKEIEEDKLSFKDIMQKVEEQLTKEITALSVASQTKAFVDILKELKPKVDNDQQLRKQVKIEQPESNQHDPVSTSSNNIESKLDYQLIQQISYKQDSKSYAIAFNEDSSIMIAGCDKTIKVFQFKQNQLKEVQRLNENQQNVTCLSFMKKINQFISTCQDIIIWGLNQTNQWRNILVLKGHSQIIRQIVLNSKDDLLVSGSLDKTIKFWHRGKKKWTIKQTIDCSNQVCSISLSVNESNLIASIYDQQILVIQLQGKVWRVNQKIAVEQYGSRLCFTNYNQFIFQPFDQKQLLVFNYDQKELKFKQGAEVKYQNGGLDGCVLFPISYIQQLNLIFVKNYEQLHIIKRQDNGQFTIEQTINFGTCCLFGCVSNDGKYIATWDEKSKEIQIRMLNR